MVLGWYSEGGRSSERFSGYEIAPRKHGPYWCADKRPPSDLATIREPLKENMDNAIKTDIVDLLRRIKACSWAKIEEPNGWSYSTNIGLLANQAADEIENLRSKLSTARAQLCEICGEPLAATALHEYCIEPISDTGVGLHASQQPNAVDLASASLRPNH